MATKKTDKPVELIDLTKLAESISEKIPYNFREYFLVKPLEPIKVQKEFSTPVPKTGKPKKDKNGIAAVDYDEVKTETKEVDADYRLAVVLKLPHNWSENTRLQQKEDDYHIFPIKIGDVVVYKNGAARDFDLIKNSALIQTYDIVGTMDTKKDESK